MEDLEESALAQANYKPLCWFRYVDDVFVIWLHGTENLERFRDNLNVLHMNMQFTMEIERDGYLPFLDIDIYRRPDGSMGHKVCRKPSHTNLYLRPGSHQLHSTYKPLFQPWCTEPGLCVTRKASMMSWSNSRPLWGKMGTAPNRYDRPSTRRLERQAHLVLHPPYFQTTYGRLHRMLAKRNIKCVGLPPRKIYSLRPVKDGLGLRTPGGYIVSCKCVYRTDW